MLSQKFVCHHLQKIRNYCHILMPCIEVLIDVDLGCFFAQKNLEEEHGPPVDTSL